MNLRTPYDVLCSLFHTNWWSRKEDDKDYSFNVFCNFFIRDQHKFLNEGKLGGKQQTHLLKGKDKNIYKYKGSANDFGPQ